MQYHCYFHLLLGYCWKCFQIVFFFETLRCLRKKYLCIKCVHPTIHHYRVLMQDECIWTIKPEIFCKTKKKPTILNFKCKLLIFLTFTSLMMFNYRDWSLNICYMTLLNVKIQHVQYHTWYHIGLVTYQYFE